MAVYSKYLESRGLRADPGTKLSFLVIKGNTPNKSLRYRPIDTEESLDYQSYYQLCLNSIYQLVSNAYPNLKSSISFDNLYG